jgi:hypothetical protein
MRELKLQSRVEHSNPGEKTRIKAETSNPFFNHQIQALTLKSRLRHPNPVQATSRFAAIKQTSLDKMFRKTEVSQPSFA